MKKAYNKPLCLDTCIFKNLLGYDEGKVNNKGIKFEETYNSKKLEKYVKHHGYLMSEYTLYEFIRDEKWNNPRVLNKLQEINRKTKQQVCAIRPELENLLNTVPDPKRIEQYAYHVFTNIVDFAGDYYSRILLFPTLFNVYSFLYLFVKRGINYNQDLINSKIEDIIQFLSDKIKHEFMMYQKYTKSISEKVINKFFLITNHVSICLYNDNMLKLSDKYESSDFTNAEEDLQYVLDTLNKMLNDIDYKENVVRCDNTKYAKATDTIMFSICNLLMKDYECTKEEWNKIFVQSIDKIAFSIYGLENNKVIDIYFRNNIWYFFTFYPWSIICSWNNFYMFNFILYISHKLCYTFYITSRKNNCKFRSTVSNKEIFIR